jgi:hypothetical protein
VKQENAHVPGKLLVFSAVNSKQLYRMRAPASGREALAHAEPGSVYVDRETDEERFPVAMVLPLAPSASALPRTPENLRACRRCDQLIGLDVSDCEYCGLRQEAV